MFDRDRLRSPRKRATKPFLRWPGREYASFIANDDLHFVDCRALFRYMKRRNISLHPLVTSSPPDATGDRHSLSRPRLNEERVRLSSILLARPRCLDCRITSASTWAMDLSRHNMGCNRGMGEGKNERVPMAFLLRTAPRSKSRMLALMRERNHQPVAELPKT